MILFFAGFFIGGMVGIFAIALVSANSRADDRYSEGFQSGLEYHKHEMKWNDDE